MSKELVDCRTEQEAVDAVRRWISAELPEAWRRAGEQGGPGAVRLVRTPDEYRAWYPAFARTGLVAAQWPHDYGGLGWDRRLSQAAERTLAPYHLPRLNPLGLNLAAPALFAHGTEEQRLRFLPKIVRNEEMWCQLFSEPGAGCDLASLATRAERDGDDWSSPARRSGPPGRTSPTSGCCLRAPTPACPSARASPTSSSTCTSPVSRYARSGTSAARSTSTRSSSTARASPIRSGSARWAMAGGSPARRSSGERQMVSGSGSGGVDRIGGCGIEPTHRAGARAHRAGLAAGRPAGAPAAGAARGARSASAAGPTRGSRRLQAGRAPGPEARSARCTRLLNQRLQAAGGRPARAPTHRLGRREAGARYADVDAVRGAAACCAAGPTPSRAAPPR